MAMKDECRSRAKSGVKWRGHGLVRWAVLLGACVALLSLAIGADAAPGLKLRLASDSSSAPATDALVVSNLAFRVEAGEALSPFVPTGPATAEWTGSIAVELRGDYEFRAETTGEFSFEIQGTNVLKASTGGTRLTDWSRPVRLRKGTNSVRAVLRRMGTEAVGVRVEWRGRAQSARPLAGAALQTRDAWPDVEVAGVRRAGRDLYLAWRCARCHDADTLSATNSLSPEAMSLAAVGGARRPGWLVEWLLDPPAQRAGARMPKLLEGPDARAEAEAIAAFLEIAAAPAGLATAKGDPAVGRSWFETLACHACHGIGAVPVPPGGVNLGHVSRKYAPGALARFLQNPATHDPWTRMPQFKLSETEAISLAAWLHAESGAMPEAPSAPRPASDPLVARGRELVAARGCGHCHRIPGTSTPRVKPIDTASAGVLERGCLGEGAAIGRAPRFALNPEERGALRVFLSLPVRPTLVRVPWDDARRRVADLRCQACHDAREGVPTLRLAGAKLRPEWTARLLSGDVAEPSRPWLTLRMPAWTAYAHELSTGLAALDGCEASVAVESAPDPEAAAVGRTLVSASGGFACVTCHPVGKAAATAVFEAPGIPFQVVAERLRPEFAARWIRDPQSVDPATKMPMYFDEEGNSPLAEHYGGDGPKTIRALWEYLRLGPRMEPPP